MELGKLLPPVRSEVILSRNSRVPKPPSQRHPLSRARIGTDDALLFTATHEAGHAVAAVVLGMPLVEVDIRTHKDSFGRSALGVTTCSDRFNHDATDRVAEALPRIIQALAGLLAERLVNPRVSESKGHETDVEAAWHLATIARIPVVFASGIRQPPDPSEINRNLPEIELLIDKATEAACELVNDYEAAINIVAARLLQKRCLSSKEVNEVVRLHPSPSPGRSYLGHITV